MSKELIDQQPASGGDERAALATLERFVDTVRECYHLASSYSGCLDNVDEHGGDDHEDPICAVFHRLYYAMFDGDKALEQARAALAQSEQKLETKGSRKALGAMNAKLRAKVGRLERELTLTQSARVPEGFRVIKPTSAVARDGDRWEIYAPCGSGGIVHEDDVTDWVVRKLLDALAAAPAPSGKGE